VFARERCFCITWFLKLPAFPIIINSFCFVDSIDSVRGYSDNLLPAPGDGPDVIRLQHGGDGHEGRWPVECRGCGENVADQLKNHIGIGSEGKCKMDFITSIVYACNIALEQVYSKVYRKSGYFGSPDNFEHP
jgi:hypothetical protein